MAEALLELLHANLPVERVETLSISRHILDSQLLLTYSMNKLSY